MHCGPGSHEAANGGHPSPGPMPPSGPSPQELMSSPHQPLYHDQRFASGHPTPSSADPPYQPQPPRRQPPHHAGMVPASPAHSRLGQIPYRRSSSNPPSQHRPVGYLQAAVIHMPPPPQQKEHVSPYQQQPSQARTPSHSRQYPRHQARDQRQRSEAPAPSPTSEPVTLPPRRQLSGSPEEEAASALLMAAGGVHGSSGSLSPQVEKDITQGYAPQQQQARALPAVANNASPSFEVEAYAAYSRDNDCVGKDDDDTETELEDMDKDEDENEDEGSVESSSSRDEAAKRQLAFLRTEKRLSDATQSSAAAASSIDTTVFPATPAPTQMNHVSPVSSSSVGTAHTDCAQSDASSLVVARTRTTSSDADDVVDRNHHHHHNGHLSRPHQYPSARCTDRDATPTAGSAMCKRMSGATTPLTRPGERCVAGQDVVQVPSVRPSQPPSVVMMPHFPSLLHDVLTNSRHAGNVLEWLPTGRGWRVLRWDEMQRSVLPEYFPELCGDRDGEEDSAAGDVNSFLWHVKAWGFQEVREFGPDMGSYKHNVSHALINCSGSF